MAVLWRIIVDGLLTAGTYFLARFFIGLGIFAVTTAAVQPLVNQFSTAINDKLNSLGVVAGQNVGAILQYAGVFDFISIILACYVAAFSVKVLKSQASAALHAASSAATSANAASPGSSGGSSGGSAGGTS